MPPFKNTPVEIGKVKFTGGTYDPSTETLTLLNNGKVVVQDSHVFAANDGARTAADGTPAGGTVSVGVDATTGYDYVQPSRTAG